MSPEFSWGVCRQALLEGLALRPRLVMSPSLSYYVCPDRQRLSVGSSSFARQMQPMSSMTPSGGNIGRSKHDEHAGSASRSGPPITAIGQQDRRRRWLKGKVEDLFDALEPCPIDHELLEFAAGNSTADSTRLHVGGCSACREKIDRLRASLSQADEAGSLPRALAATPNSALIDVAETTDFSLGTKEGRQSAGLPIHGETPARPETIGRYRIVGELDSGGQAAVYRAAHPTLPRDVAVKIAHESSAIDCKLLRGDAEILCELDHPNLVRVHDLDIHEGRAYVVMEFVRGRNLQQIAAQSLPAPQQAVAWVSAIARALDYVHSRGVVHQDIKPKNIMLDELGRPRLIDFGVARWRHAWNESDAGPSGGTVAFMAPEQARGELERVGAPSDIFSLGGVLYFLLTGKSPYGGDTFEEAWRRCCRCDFDREILRQKRVGRRLEHVVLTAMAAEPQNRYASAGEMATALEAYAKGPRRIVTGVGGVLLLVLPAASAWSWWARGDARKPSPTNDQSAQHIASSPQNSRIVASNGAGGPLQIETLDVVLHRREPGDPVGRIGVNVFEGRLNQDARVQARLTAPGYCYLIALNPDGSNNLCFPEAKAKAPTATTRIDFPSDPASGFSLTDGAGTQAFVLVASAEPLPPFSEWTRRLGTLPWRPVQTDAVWRFDGRSFESGDSTRGGVRPLLDVPPPLEATCRTVRTVPGVTAVRATAFPVLTPRNPKSQNDSG